jgi:predicted membrane protein
METSMSNSSAEQGGWGLVFIVCLIPFYVHRYKILVAISAFFEKIFIFIGYALLYAGSAAAICAVIWFIFNGVKTMFRRRRQEKEDERLRQDRALLNADSSASKQPIISPKPTRIRSSCKDFVSIHRCLS